MIAVQQLGLERSLIQLKAVIERGQQTFIEVGEALAEIQERRLYRQYGYETFEEYCRDRWGWTRGHAYNLIHATEVVHNVLPIITARLKALAALAYKDVKRRRRGGDNDNYEGVLLPIDWLVRPFKVAHNAT